MIFAFFFCVFAGGEGGGCAGGLFFCGRSFFFSGDWAGAYAFCCLGRGMVWLLNSKNKATAQTRKNHARPNSKYKKCAPARPAKKRDPPKQQKQHPNRPNNKKDQTATKNNVYLASTKADCQAGGGSQLQIRPRRSGFMVWGLGFIKAYTPRGILRSSEVCRDIWRFVGISRDT